MFAAIGIAATRVRDDESGLQGINRGFYIAAACGVLLSAVAAFSYLPSSFAEIDGVGADTLEHPGDPRFVLIGAVIVGVALAAVILRLTGHYTGTESGPTRRVAAATQERKDCSNCASCALSKQQPPLATRSPSTRFAGG